MSVLGLIIGRGGSKGVPGKHLRRILGKRVVDHVIDFALAEDALDAVALSSDSPALLDIAHARGVTALARPPDLARAESTVSEVVVHALKAMDLMYRRHFDRVAVLYGCVPWRPAGCLGQGLELLEATGASAVRSYCPVWKFQPEFMVRLDGDRVRPYMDTPHFRRQDMPDLYYPDGAVILVRRQAVLACLRDDGTYDHHYLGDDVRGFVLPFPGAIEIDEELDLTMAAAVMRGAFDIDPQKA